MNKKQMINEIMDLYDENEMLKSKLKRFEMIKEEASEFVQELEKTEKEKIIEELNNKAKKILFEKSFYDWHLPSVKVKDESNEFNFLTFEQWFKAINIYNCLCSEFSYILEDLTQNEVKEYFKPQLENWFNNKVNKEKMELVRAKKNEQC